jgi:16S rRNA (guanine966-N2)-methyltransferase
MSGQVRIISGCWRGRKLPVLNKPGLRPTPDRLRETLFNWLATPVINSCCLDLFAGSGALGIEAVSRGAQQAWLIEKEREVAQNLVRQVTRLATSHITVIQTDVLKFLKRPIQSFDLVFLDPPFGYQLVSPCCYLLEAGAWLKPGGYIYFEIESQLAEPFLPTRWQIVRRQKAGNVAGFLVKRGIDYPEKNGNS